MKSAFEIVLGSLLAGALVIGCSRGEKAVAEDHVTPRASIECANCHLPEFASTNHPPHPGVRPTSCGVCHTQSAWHGWRVDHEGWALTGAHARVAADEQVAGAEKQVKCFWCHRDDAVKFKVKDKSCLGCHASDRENATPPHEDFSTACETCHSTESWKVAKEPPKPEPNPEPTTTTSVDAGPAPPPSAKPKPKPKPPKPPPTATGRPPDVISRPSGHR